MGKINPEGFSLSLLFDSATKTINIPLLLIEKLLRVIDLP